MVLDNVGYLRTFNCDHLMTLLKEAAEGLSKSKFAIVIVDSATHCYRTDYPGQGMLPAR